MLIRLLFCLILAATVEGSARQNHNLKRQINSAETARTWLPYYSWKQFRIAPWFLRRPSVWHLEPRINHINLAAIKRRVSHHSRKSKWSKLYAKLNRNHFNKVPKLNPFLSLSRSSDSHSNGKSFPKTWKSAYNYAKPSWLLRLRKKLNIHDNKVDVLPKSKSFTSTELGNKHYAKYSRLQWNPNNDRVKSSKSKNYEIPIPQPNRLFEGEFRPKTETQKNILPAIGENSSDEDDFWSGENTERPSSVDESSFSVKSDIPGLFGPYESLDHSGSQLSNERSDGFLAPSYLGGTGEQNIFDFPEPDSHLKSPKYSVNAEDKSGDSFEAHGMSSGSIGNPFSDPIAQPLEQSMGESFGQVDERSASDSTMDGFESFDSFLPIPNQEDDIYSDTSYTDFDDTGFSSFGSFGPYGGSSFVEETDDCDGIETRSCVSDSECVCFGIYFCQEGTCASISTASENKDSSEEMPGFWHDTPMTE